MNYGIFDFLTLIGSLTLFLFGMKLMSESLQKVAGDKMRTILAAMTSNKFKGILTGFLITAIIQSSSATTVMLVSFVNAGLVTLSESIGVIMGSNIGTTVTAWLISILGFKIEISTLVLPILGIAIPLVFSSNRKHSNIGGVIIGFALIFIGLDFLKDATPEINNNPEMLQFLSRFSHVSFWSITVFLIIGTLLTMIIQSSSAAMALTLVMCFNGWISYEMAAVLVLGQNIGTTITANLAALIANTAAKRAARAHLVFNFIGVIIVLIFFRPFLNFVDWITVSTGSVSPYSAIGNTDKEIAEAIPIALSIFHTVFNFLNTVLLIWFVPQILKIVVWMVPQKDTDEEFNLKYIKTGILSTSELSILQAKKETILYAEHIKKMMLHTKNVVTNPNSKKIHKLLDKTEKLENISDRMEEEIADYLTHITEESLSIKSTEDINMILTVISDLEDIGDICNNISKIIERKIDQKMVLTPAADKQLIMLFELVEKQIDLINVSLTENKPDNYKLVVKLENHLQTELKNTRNNHYKSLKRKEYKCKSGIVYSDLYSGIAKIGSIAYEINMLVLNSLGINE